MKYILCCKCANTPEFSKEAFKLLFKDEECPEICAGNMNITNLCKWLPDSNFKNQAKILSKSKDKFSYLFEIDDKGDILSQYNLLTGKKVL